MFNVQEFVNTLTVEPDDEKLTQANEMVQLTTLICEDSWLCRQAMFGVAGAMERQMQFLGGTLIPNSERSLNTMSSRGVGGEAYVAAQWVGTSNSLDEHINDEIPVEDKVADKQMFIEDLKHRMRTAAIIFAVHLREHDELSGQLDQLSYYGIKASANAKRASVEASRKIG
jgi:hypothetical protein